MKLFMKSDACSHPPIYEKKRNDEQFSMTNSNKEKGQKDALKTTTHSQLVSYYIRTLQMLHKFYNILEIAV